MPRAPKWSELPAKQRRTFLRHMNEWAHDNENSANYVGGEEYAEVAQSTRAAIRVLRAAAKPKKGRR